MILWVAGIAVLTILLAVVTHIAVTGLRTKSECWMCGEHRPLHRGICATCRTRFPGQPIWKSK